MPDPQEEVMALPPEEFVKRLARHERVLVELRDVLYEGEWDDILEDLRASSHEGEPYLFKFSENIGRDIAAIEKLKKYEEQHEVNLSRWIKTGEE